jgi:hypothetical protein
MRIEPFPTPRAPDIVWKTGRHTDFLQHPYVVERSTISPGEVKIAPHNQIPN